MSAIFPLKTCAKYQQTRHAEILGIVALCQQPKIPGWKSQITQENHPKTSLRQA